MSHADTLMEKQTLRKTIREKLQFKWAFLHLAVCWNRGFQTEVPEQKGLFFFFLCEILQNLVLGLPKLRCI